MSKEINGSLVPRSGDLHAAAAAANEGPRTVIFRDISRAERPRGGGDGGGHEGKRAARGPTDDA